MVWTTLIEDDSTYQVQSETATVNLIEVTNDGPNTCYYGRTEDSRTATGATENLSASVTISDPTAPIRQGMTVSGTGIQAGSLVTAVNGNVITLSLPVTATGSATLTFTAPLNEDTGVPIAMGATKSFTPAAHRQFLQGGFGVYVKAGEQAQVRFHKLFN